MLLCDYKFGDETIREIQERFLEMMDQAVHSDDLHIAEEMNTGKCSCLRIRLFSVGNYSETKLESEAYFNSES